MSKSIGTLTVDLLLKMGGFEQGMDRTARQTKQRMREISKSVDAAAARLRNFVMAGAGAILAGTAITAALVSNARQSIDEQVKLSRSLDGTVSGIRAVALAADDAGMEGFEASLNRLNRRLGAVEMAGGPAVKTVERLKLNLEAMRTMDVDERLAHIADRIRDYGGSAQESARHLQQLGFEQRTALDLFTRGGDVIRSARDEIDRYGLSITQVDATKVEMADDIFRALRLTQEGLVQQLTVEVAPILMAIGENFNDMAKEASDSGLTVEEMFDRFIVGGINAASSFRAVGIPLKNMMADIWNGFKSLPSWVQEVGIVGAMMGGRIGIAALVITSKAVEDTKATVAWAKALADGTITFSEWASKGPGQAREALKELGIEIDNILFEGPSIIQSLFGEPDQEDPEAWASRMVANYRTAVSRARERAQQSIDEKPPAQDMGSTYDPEALDAAAKLLEMYKSQEESLQRQIALFGDATMASAFKYDSELVALAELDPKLNDRLILLTKEMDALKALEQVMASRKDTMKEFASEAARNMQSSLANFLFDPFDKGVKGMLKSFGNVMRQMIAQVVAAQVLKSLFGGFAGSSNSFLAGIGEAFVGKKDGGGHVPAGKWAIAGEIGPEIVTGPANVISRADTANMMGGGVQINVINNAGVNVRQTEPRFDGGRQIVDMIIDTVKTGMGQGSLDDSLSQHFGISRSGGRG